MWPDCSPPIDRSRLSISSITYLSPTGQRISSMSLALSASSRPMLLMTVATTALPFSTPCERMCRAHNSSTASPSTIRPLGIDEDRAIAVAVEGNAHPQAPSRTSAASRSGCVDPQSRLMFRPSGVVADHRDVVTELGEEARSHRGGGAIGGIEPHPEPRRAGSGWETSVLRAPGTRR